MDTKAINKAVVTLVIAFVFNVPELSSADDSKNAASVPGFELTNPRTYQFKIQLIVQAEGRRIRGVKATGPIPMNWREQKVKLLNESKPRGAKTKDRKLDGRGSMIEFTVPSISAGATAVVERAYEVTRYHVRLTVPREELRIPTQLNRTLRGYLTEAPGIDVKNAEIVELAKAIAKPDEAWTTTRAFYDWIRENVKYQEGEFHGAAKTLQRKIGDCEDHSALFVSLCRVSKIPARTVWIDQHAYAEFYLEDAKGAGYWIPAEMTGPRWFGESQEYRTILQKGDKFRDPIRRRFTHYIPQSLKAVGGTARFSLNRGIIDAKAQSKP